MKIKLLKPIKIISLVLASSMLLSGCSLYSRIEVPKERETIDESKLPEGTKLEDIRLDFTLEEFEEKTSEIEKCLNDVEEANGEASNEAVQLFEELIEDYRKFLDAILVGKMYYDSNTVDKDINNQYQNLIDIKNDVAQIYDDIATKMLKAGYYNQIADKYGKMVFYLAYTEANLDEADYIKAFQEQELISRYLDLNAQIKYDDNGKATNMDELQDEIGEIYLELLKLRNEAVKDTFYNSYPAYFYAESYKRDFDINDAKKLCKYVKQYIVPAYVEFIDKQDLKEERDYIEAICELKDEDFFKLVGNETDSVSENLQNAFAFMEKYNLCKFGPYENGTNQGYTQYLSYYSEPYTYIKRNYDGFDLNTLIHEFGHYYSDYSNSANAGQIDIAEINSQGLECLYTGLSEDMLGEKFGKAYTTYTYKSMMESILIACIRDEFEQAAYDMENPTVEDLNELYLKLYKEYGCDHISDMDDDLAKTEWMRIHHFFDHQCYCISYATTAIMALEIMEQAQTNFDEACDTYQKTVDNAGMSSLTSFSKKCGLTYPINEKRIIAIAEGIEKYGTGK